MRWFLRLFKKYRDMETELNEALRGIAELSKDTEKTTALAHKLIEEVDKYVISNPEQTSKAGVEPNGGGGHAGHYRTTDKTFIPGTERTL